MTSTLCSRTTRLRRREITVPNYLIHKAWRPGTCASPLATCNHRPLKQNKTASPSTAARRYTAHLLSYDLVAKNRRVGVTIQHRCTIMQRGILKRVTQTQTQTQNKSSQLEWNERKHGGAHGQVRLVWWIWFWARGCACEGSWKWVEYCTYWSIQGLPIMAAFSR